MPSTLNFRTGSHWLELDVGVFENSKPAPIGHTSYCYSLGIEIYESLGPTLTQQQQVQTEILNLVSQSTLLTDTSPAHFRTIVEFDSHMGNYRPKIVEAILKNYYLKKKH